MARSPRVMGIPEGAVADDTDTNSGLKPYDPEQNTTFVQLDAGTQIYLFETDDDEKTKAKVYNHGNSFGSFPPPHSHSHGHGGGIIKGDCCYGELHQGKPQPFVVEVAGKLFVLSGGPVNFFSPAFEEFNSNKGTWTTLPDPPYVWPYPGEHRYFSYAIVGTKIMVSTPITSVFCFDVVAPNPGQWSLCCAEPFPFEGRALVLDFEEDDNCNKIVFGYEHIPGHGYDVVAYTMFKDDENGYFYCHRITPLHLLTQFSELIFGSEDTFSFVHLGGRKVCFVIACYIAEADDDDFILADEDMDLIVVTFEFSISEKDGNSIRFFSTKTLGSCIFPFDFASESGSMFEGKLLNCFVR